MKNALDRHVPAGFSPYSGGIDKDTLRPRINKRPAANKKDKLVSDIALVFDRLKIGDGATLSFHHHLRAGDEVMNLALSEAKRRGLKNLTLAPSSVFPNHKLLAEMIESGAVRRIYTDYLNGPAAAAICGGKMDGLLVMDTHGGRSYAIETGDIEIDVAFIATPCATAAGDGNGFRGPSACGSLGYAVSDMYYAKRKVVVTDYLVEEVENKQIIGEYIDYVLKVDRIGRREGIMSGTTRITRDPVGLLIADAAARVLAAAGALEDGFSFQTGAGGISLAVADRLKRYIKEKNILAAFASGGITEYIVAMHNEGLVRDLYDVQCFDLAAVASIGKNERHRAISAAQYASILENNVADRLDIVILGATEVDTDFNVNVTTASDGLIIGGSGGHADTANGARITVIVTPLLKTRLPVVKDRVVTVTTPGRDVDIVVTERGIAVNPARADLLEKLAGKGLPLVTIEELRDKAIKIAGRPERVPLGKRVVGVVRHRDLSVVDAIYETGGRR